MIFRILDNANELTKLIACHSSAVGELIKRWIDKPSILTLLKPIVLFQ